MFEDYADHFFCRQHVPPVSPSGYRCLPNLRVECMCEQCGEVAELVVGPKPLAQPKLSYA